MSEEQRGLVPAQQGDRNRVWVVDSFARLPAFSSMASQAAAEQSGYWSPRPAKRDMCAQPGVFLAMSDYDASLTVPGAQKVDVGAR